MSLTTPPTPASPAPARGRLPRIPFLCPFDDRAVADVAELARGRHLRLVHDGKGLFLTPIVLPGQFIVAEAA